MVDDGIQDPLDALLRHQVKGVHHILSFIELEKD